MSFLDLSLPFMNPPFLDLLPGYSPWLRNAGRKKSHPVWDFFKDLKDTSTFSCLGNRVENTDSDGVGGVVCLHCNWSGDDRSPNNLRTHLKKFHTLDGIFAKFSQKLAQVNFIKLVFFSSGKR